MKKVKDITRLERPLSVLDHIVNERVFLILIMAGFISAGLFLGNKQVVMWLGFAFAAYAAVANDSIQSIGTFIESNKERK
ncbi:MAG: hypothetical protein LC643_06365, partial [Bacteroidales bacterium]|nr:hypothetical protein [Bacteroidales bacterium]